MRKNEIQLFAKELQKLENKYGVFIHSDNYHTRAIVNDISSGLAYHYKEGEIELDQNTFVEVEDY